MVFAHMGGGVIGDLDTCARLLRASWPSVARCAGAVGRLSPGAGSTASRPASTTCWPPTAGRGTNAGRFGAPAGTRRRSAAIPWAATSPPSICQELRRHGEPQPALQLLIYPVVDVASETAVDDHLRRRLSAVARPDGLVHRPLPRPRRRSDRSAALADRRRGPVRPRAGRRSPPPASIRWSTRARPTPSGCSEAGRAGASIAATTASRTPSRPSPASVPAADVACREIAGLVREAMAGAERAA